MARPANTESGITRAQIVRSARALFARHGYDGTSTRDIARRARVSLATLHHHFGSKEGLWEACADSIYDDLEPLRDELAGVLQRATSLEDLVTQVVSGGFRFAVSHRETMRFLTRNAVASGKLNARGRDVLVTFLDRVTEALALMTGRPARSLRLPLQSLVFLVARYSVQDPGELALVVGHAPGDASAPDADLEEARAHLVELALALVAPARRPSRARKRGD